MAWCIGSVTYGCLGSSDRGGGATQEGLINNGRALNGIKTNNWDYVVLQEQSVRPAIYGKSEQAFHDAVDLLVKEIKDVGAEPLLYMTWGRRDTLEIKDESILDYETMQQKLSDAYRKAADSTTATSLC